ncbi:alpha/beta hydrolase [Streptomyces sp. NPDC060194]|uniref:alpha/beta hydrolase n=1 Tax=Streptomyces sp. NPDC060194 TaxID=3347069 RepID=UPI0036479BF0
MTSSDLSPQFTVWRAILVLAVVFVMMSTTGWTAVRLHKDGLGAVPAAVAAWNDATLPGGRQIPDADASSGRLAHFFSRLDQAQRVRLAERHPLVVGNLNGAPVALRYRANRAALENARAAERRRSRDADVPVRGRQDAARLVHRFDSMLRPGRQILAFDPTGTGRAAEVFGDLDRAKRVSVVVPGVDTNLMTYERSARRYSAPQGMASALYDAQRAAAPRVGSAVIAWADYSAPVGVGMDAMLGKRAETGAGRLHALLDGLPKGADTTLFCHSYGSVVCGVAAPDLPDRVTDVVVAGSPGMRVSNAAELRTGARVWAARDADDWIADVPHLELGGLGHGADPVAAGFGARVVSADRAVGHTGYFTPGTESLANFAEIGTGAYAGVTCAGGADACHDGISGGSGT